MTNVYWLSYHDDILARGYWDQGQLEELLAGPDYTHHIGIDNPQGGGIVVINGRTHTSQEDIAKINTDIAKLSWCLFIETGDEEALFPFESIRHPMLRRWVMLPRMNMHNDVNFKMPNGYRPQTRPLLKEIGIKERNIDVLFIGQVNHARREQAVEAMEALPAEKYQKYLVTTDGFGKEVVAYPEYMSLLANTKVALCPSGVESPDNFRLYEALEAGCLPIVDAFATKNQDWGFWQYLFGNDIPFPIVPYWDELPNILPELLRDWPHNANRASAWWQLRKRDMRNKLIDDMKEINNG